MRLNPLTKWEIEKITEIISGMDNEELLLATGVAIRELGLRGLVAYEYDSEDGVLCIYEEEEDGQDQS